MSKPSERISRSRSKDGSKRTDISFSQRTRTRTRSNTSNRSKSDIHNNNLIHSKPPDEGIASTRPRRKKSFEIKSSPVCTAGSQGRREYMEDTRAYFDTLSGTRLFGVFDGHGINKGEMPSKYAAKEFLPILARHIEPALSKSESVIRHAATAAFIEMDKNMHSHRWAVENGTTAVVAVLPQKGDALYIFHVGDSRGVVYDVYGKVLSITKDHKPDDEEERKRIIAAGGTVPRKEKGDSARVDGQLAMSRALGDWMYKVNADGNLDNINGKVSVVPSMMRILLTPNTTYRLVLASDGIWDVMTAAQVGKWISENQDKLPEADWVCTLRNTVCMKKYNSICTSLTEHAIRIGSSDNVTASIVQIVTV